MKVLQTITGLSATSGGPSTCTHDLMVGLNAIGAPVDLLTSRCPEEDILGEGCDWLKTIERDYCTPLQLSKNFKQELEKSNYDLYHGNALWMYPTHITCKIARKKNKPYVLSPHGMLYPSALKIKRWKKIPMLKLWFNKDIHNATCLHATCMEEAEHCRTFGYKGPIAVIPNPVVFPEYANEMFAERCARVYKTNTNQHEDVILDKHRLHGSNGYINKNNTNKVQGSFLGKAEKEIPILDTRHSTLETSGGRKQIGFLGRLHPIKKVENLIYALDLLKPLETAEGVKLLETVSLEIMGKGLDDYEAFLRSEVKRLGLEDVVNFVGFVNGKEKYERLSRLSALMVPSVQENFGMIVPEALICGTPVYSSLGTPWEELNEYNAGWWKDNNIDTIADVIKKVLSMSEEELFEMGKNGRKLIEEKYEQHKVAEMMYNLYRWIAGEIEKPEFVQTV